MGSLTFVVCVVLSVWAVEGFLRVFNENGRGSNNWGVIFSLTETDGSVRASVEVSILAVVSRLELGIRLGSLWLVRTTEGLLSSLVSALGPSILTVFIVSFVSDVSLLPMSLASVVWDVAFSEVDFCVLASVVVDTDAVVDPLRIVLYLKHQILVQSFYVVVIPYLEVVVSWDNVGLERRKVMYSGICVLETTSELSPTSPSFLEISSPLLE